MLFLLSFPMLCFCFSGLLFFYSLCLHPVRALLFHSFFHPLFVNSLNFFPLSVREIFCFAFAKSNCVYKIQNKYKDNITHNSRRLKRKWNGRMKISSSSSSKLYSLTLLLCLCVCVVKFSEAKMNEE